MPRDYYEVLGLSKSASAEEISKAYKSLARKHHPDRNPGDKNAEGRFKEIQNAYDVLNDPKKKAIYDQFGTEVPPGAAGGGLPWRIPVRRRSANRPRSRPGNVPPDVRRRWWRRGI